MSFLEADANIERKFYPVEVVLIHLLDRKNINYKIANIDELLYINVLDLKDIEGIIFDLKKELPELPINLNYENTQLRLSIWLRDVIFKEKKRENLISKIKEKLFRVLYYNH